MKPLIVLKIIGWIILAVIALIVLVLCIKVRIFAEYSEIDTRVRIQWLFLKIPLFPTATLYENSLGGTVVTLAGSTIFDRGLAEGFCFLCEGRKNFLARLLSELSALPAYYPDDAEAMVVAARLTDGSLMVVAIDTSLDEIENFPIATELDVKEIRRLLPSGEYEKVGFKKVGDRIETNIILKPYDPQIFILKQ